MVTVLIALSVSNSRLKMIEYHVLNHCCDVTLLLKVLILFKESTVIQLILKRIHTVDS